MDVSDFNNSAKLETLKSTFRAYGPVSYVHFLGPTRALIEFNDPNTVAKILALGDPVVVNGKAVRVAIGNANMKRKPSRNPNATNGRGGNNIRGNNRGKNNTARQ